MTNLAKTTEVTKFVRDLKAVRGVVVNENKVAGTVVAKEGEITVFRAIQKGKKQPWIVTFTDGETVKWK